MHSITVRSDDPIDQVVANFAKDPGLRGIFVVDKQNRFVGVITRFELLQWTKYKLVPEIQEELDWKIISDIKKYVYSTKAVEIINKGSSKAFLRMDDQIAKALHLMADYSLIDLPILDEKGKIIGDLKLSDLLNRILKTSSPVSGR